MGLKLPRFVHGFVDRETSLLFPAPRLRIQSSPWLALLARVYERL